MAARAMNITGMITPVQRRAVAGVTPEFYFQKAIDNSRLVKVADPKSRREIRMFSTSVAALFLLVMFYAWQHFSALEYGYHIEAQKAERDRLVEVNRTLRLEEAGLRDPGRIDLLARQQGLVAPQPSQVVRMESDEPGTAVMARVGTIAVISGQ